MSDLKESIFQALVSEFWGPHADSFRMAQTAAKVAGVSNPDLGTLKAIIRHHLIEPNFTAMAAELAEVLGEPKLGKGDFTVNGELFNVGQVPYGQFEGKWVWSSELDEGLPFNSAFEAQADCLRYVSEREAADSAEWKESGQYVYEREMAHESRRGK